MLAIARQLALLMLGRDRTRVYALLRSGDLIAVWPTDEDRAGPLRVDRPGIEFIRGSASDSALDTLLQRGLVAHNPHHLLVTTRAFLEFASLKDLADVPPLPATE